LLLLPLAIRSGPGTGNIGMSPHSKAGVHKGSGTDGSSSATRMTSEPQLPLGVTAETSSLQKNARGGVATILLKISAAVPIEEAVVSARTPSRLVFADGSASRTWKIDLTTGGALSLPVEVIVPEDGKYSISIEVAGKTEGKAIRRALSHKLYVGVKEKKGKDKDGANESPAIEAPQEVPQS
jgi:hypothetical protein